MYKLLVVIAATIDGTQVDARLRGYQGLIAEVDTRPHQIYMNNINNTLLQELKQNKNTEEIEEAVVTTKISLSNRRVENMNLVKNTDSTKIYAIYFPQFHEDRLNNRLWGKGFTGKFCHACNVLLLYVSAIK